MIVAPEITLMNLTEDGIIMSECAYNDEYRGGSKIVYDGELIDMEEGMYRHKRDKARQHNYVRAQEVLDEEQVTWSDVENLL